MTPRGTYLRLVPLCRGNTWQYSYIPHPVAFDQRVRGVRTCWPSYTFVAYRDSLADEAILTFRNSCEALPTEAGTLATWTRE